MDILEKVATYGYDKLASVEKLDLALNLIGFTGNPDAIAIKSLPELFEKSDQELNNLGFSPENIAAIGSVKVLSDKALEYIKEDKGMFSAMDMHCRLREMLQKEELDEKAFCLYANSSNTPIHLEKFNTDDPALYKNVCRIAVELDATIVYFGEPANTASPESKIKKLKDLFNVLDIHVGDIMTFVPYALTFKSRMDRQEAPAYTMTLGEFEQSFLFPTTTLPEQLEPTPQPVPKQTEAIPEESVPVIDAVIPSQETKDPSDHLQTAMALIGRKDCPEEVESIEQLLNFKTPKLKMLGFTEEHITRLTSVRQLAALCIEEKATVTENAFADDKAIDKYLRLKIGNRDVEFLTVMFLDDKNRLLGTLIKEGTVSSTMLSPRDLVKEAFRLDADQAVVSHNHPSGKTDPSGPDLNVTDMVVKALTAFDIKVRDHVIVGNDVNSFSFRQNKMLDVNDVDKNIFKGVFDDDQQKGVKV